MELVVVMAILALIALVLIPFLATIRGRATRSESQNNLKMMALACHSFHDAFNGLPPALGKSAILNPRGQAVDVTCHFLLLPFLDENRTLELSKGDLAKVANIPVRIFTDPKDTEGPSNHVYQGWLATTNYAANWMVFGEGGMKLFAIKDGTSNTLMFAERYQMCNGQPTAWAYPYLSPWAPIFGFFSQDRFQLAPTQSECDPALAQTYDRFGILVAMCDGSVRTVGAQCSPRTWWAATCPDDGMLLGNDF